MVSDPVQVVGEAREAHGAFDLDCMTGDFRCRCGAPLKLRGLTESMQAGHTRHINEAIVAALQEAGLLAEGQVVGYVVVEQKPGEAQWGLVDDMYRNLGDAGAVLSDEHSYRPHSRFRVAALHLLPDTEEPGNG